MKILTLKAKLTFVEPVLGTASGNPQIQEEFKASKAPTIEKGKEEVAAVTPATEEDLAEQIEKASTVFPKDEHGVFAWDYQIRGYFKGALYPLIETGQVKLSKWCYAKVVDLFVFVNPRRIYFKRPDGTNCDKSDITTLQRPLRAKTMQGDRIALARSEQLPPGVTLEFEISYLPGTAKSVHKDLTMDDLKDCLDYGRLVGYSQWRGGGFGRFSWVEVA